jgi:ribosomal protein S18 acetylase RimI-like enzyme
LLAPTGNCNSTCSGTAYPWQWLQRTFRKRENTYYVCDRLKGPSMKTVAELWASCFDNLELLTAQGVADVTTAIDHSFTVVYAFVECTDDDALSSDDAAEPRLIGAARTLSDGQFAAQVLDVCVHDDYRRQGIGSKLVKYICEHTKGCGPQSLAVFAGSVRTTTACPVHQPPVALLTQQCVSSCAQLDMISQEHGYASMCSCVSC